jgi:hypothetical protein
LLFFFGSRIPVSSAGRRNLKTDCKKILSEHMVEDENPLLHVYLSIGVKSMQPQLPVL